MKRKSKNGHMNFNFTAAAMHKNAGWLYAVLILIFVATGIFMAALYPAIANRPLQRELAYNREMLREMLTCLLEYERKHGAPAESVEIASKEANNRVVLDFLEINSRNTTYSRKSIYSGSDIEILRLRYGTSNVLIGSSDLRIRKEALDKAPE